MRRRSSEFFVIPAIDLMGGKVVRLRQGKVSDVTFSASNPLKIAKMWVEKGARVLHIIDLDGSFCGRMRHEKIIEEIASLGIELQVGGGIRDFRTAERLLEIGATRVIFGTLAVEKVRELREFAENHAGSVMIAIDSRGGRVVVRGWREETKLSPLQLAELYDDLDVSFLFTNVDVEGLVSGVERGKIEEVVSSLTNPVYVAGGFSSVEEVRFAKRCGAAGVVIGSALYTGRLKFEDVVRIEHEEEEED